MFAAGVFHDGLRHLTADMVAAAAAFGILLSYAAAIAAALYGGIWIAGRFTPVLPAPEKVEDDL